MPLLVAAEVQAVAVLACPLAADNVDAVAFLLEPLLDPRSPAAVLCDGVDEEYPPDGRGLGNSQGRQCEEQESRSHPFFGCT
jgi:hypothetical protein